MRRSAAPSQTGARPKFVAPFRAPIAAQVQRPVSTLNKERLIASITSIKKPAVEDVSTSRTIAPSKPDAPEMTVSSSAPVEAQPVKRARFESPLSPRTTGPDSTCSRPGQAELVANKENTNETAQKKYFNVVWCKRSNKKHKKWEGDAVLITCGRSVTLLDTEGKEIGKSSGYKSTELLSLKEDETLPIGGKEIQVMSTLTEEEYRTGKCFTGSAACHTAAATDTAPSRLSVVSKPFSKPLKSSTGQVLPSPEPVQVKPRHDPSQPGALVMPKPSTSHQWSHNRRDLQVVDVVVDPYLGLNLRPHQRAGVLFLYECVMGYRPFGGHGAILADDMGLGKTLQCITLIWTLYKQGPYGGKAEAKKILVITPGSLVKNWHMEFKKWLGFERLQVFAVSAANKVEDYLKTSIYPVLVISYEMFLRNCDTLAKVHFDLVVCDEGHRLKNTTIKTTSVIMGLSTKHRVVLTGTPIQNDLQEFFSIVEFCNPGVLGSSGAFKRVYEDPIVASRQPRATPSEVTLGEDRGAELSRMTQMFILRRTSDINNKYLPPKCDIVVFCRPTALQLTLYDRLLHSQLVRTCLSGGGPGGSNHLICIAALKQLCNHPRLIHLKAQRLSSRGEQEGGAEDMSSVYAGLLPLFPVDFGQDPDLESHSGKLFVLAQLLHQIHTSPTTEKIVVVANHTKTLDLIQTMCESKSYSLLRLDGQTPTSKRQELVQRFNSKHATEFVFLLSSKAGGVGLNLIGASRLILYDIDWNPANDLQAMARVWRDGQKKKVHIYRLLTTGSIEEKVYQRQISKQSLSGAVMDIGADKNNVQFSLEDLKDLFSINIHTDCDTHDLLACDCGRGGEDSSGPRGSTGPGLDIATRACQLGAKVNKKKKNLGMDQLMEWKHYPGCVVAEQQEWYLQEAEAGISFVFYSEVNSPPT